MMKNFVRSRILFTFVLLSCASLAQSGNMLFTDHPLAGKIWDMNSRSYLDEAALLAMISKPDVLILGEIHDNPLHHEYQQKLLKARIASGARSGLTPVLMMEQLNADDQPALDRALAGSDHDEALNSVNALVRFSNAQDYQPLLAIAVDNKLPVIAANVSSRKLQPVIRRGYAAFDPGELKRLMVEEVWNDERQDYLVTHMGSAHCGKLSDELRAGLSRSQRLRDALMVDSAAAGFARGMVAIVGNSHARRDIGLPLYFTARDPRARVVSVAFVEVSPGVTDPSAYLADSATGEVPFDVIWFTPRADRVDPCADFNQPKDKQPSVGEPEAKP